VAVIEVIIDWLLVGVFKVERYVELAFYCHGLQSMITKPIEPAYEINLGID
jgi:hypothetical protein